MPSGMRYAVLVLPPDEKRMDSAVLQKLEHLLKAGLAELMQTSGLGNTALGQIGCRPLGIDRRLRKLQSGKKLL